MAIDRIIIRSTPKIAPNKIAVRDTDDLTTENGAPVFESDKTEEGNVSRSGTMSPIILIGSIRIPEQAIKSLTLFQDDLLPRVSITILDEGSVFGAGAYPISNIIASIFIRSQNKKLKSVAGDYLITTVSSFAIPGTTSTVYTLGGELHVPKINGNFSKSFSKMTSLQALKSVADDLLLGFADNQLDDTNDKMTWLMPNYSYKSFINHVKKMAYRDDSNFFDCFIDRYYILNFVNVEKMFSQDEEIDKGFMALAQASIDKRRMTRGVEDEDEDQSPEVELLLNNHASSKGSEFYISEFSLTSNHGEVLANHGLRKHAYWYDHGGNSDPNTVDSVNFINHFTEPLTTPTSNDGLSPQTTAITDFTKAESVGRIWNGIDYGNAHAYYKFANLINRHNLLEIKKNQLKVSLPGLNSNIIRGSRVAIALYLNRMDSINAISARKEATDQDKVTNDGEASQPEKSNSGGSAQVYDKSLSGFYYVSSIKYSYIDGKFMTDMLLSRRHWLLPRPENKVLP